MKTFVMTSRVNIDVGQIMSISFVAGNQDGVTAGHKRHFQSMSLPRISHFGHFEGLA